MLQCYGGDESGLTSELERPSCRSVDDEEEDNASGRRQECKKQEPRVKIDVKLKCVQDVY